jgi:hypothetical protein
MHQQPRLVPTQPPLLLLVLHCHALLLPQAPSQHSAGQLLAHHRCCCHCCRQQLLLLLPSRRRRWLLL